MKGTEMKVGKIIQDLEQSLEEMSEEYKTNIKNRTQEIINKVEYSMVGTLASEIIERDWQGKEKVKEQVFLALEERLKKSIDEIWERLKNGSYRSMTLDQYLEKKIADLIDRKINESLDKVELMVVRGDQQEERE